MIAGLHGHSGLVTFHLISQLQTACVSFVLLCSAQTSGRLQQAGDRS